MVYFVQVSLAGGDLLLGVCLYSIHLLKIIVDAGKSSYDCNQLLAILSWLWGSIGKFTIYRKFFIVCQYNITYFAMHRQLSIVHNTYMYRQSLQQLHM